MWKLLTVVGLVFFIPLSAHAGGGGGAAAQCRAFGSGQTITMFDSCFDSVAFSAPSDQAITITNDGEIPHTLTAVDGSFDTGILSRGEQIQLTIEQDGIYEVFCTLHGTPEGDGMAGLLIVGEPAPGSIAASVVPDGPPNVRVGENRATTADVGVPPAGTSPSPIVLTVPDGIIPNTLVLISVGASVALALAALMTALFRQGVDRQVMRERLTVEGELKE